MKILVTGSGGFIGKNLVCQLHNLGYSNILEYDRTKSEKDLDEYTKQCEFVFHLAGVNRIQNKNECMEENYNFTLKLIQALKRNNNKSSILYSSSIQAELDNEYGKSKKLSEEILLNYSKQNNVKIIIYRLTNVFGKWCKTNYNSVVATFCYNIANNIPIKINDKNTVLNLAYIDDVVEEFINIMNEKKDTNKKYYYNSKIYSVKLGKIATLIKSFKKSRENLYIPNTKNEFIKKLYSTYLSYLPENNFAYNIKTNTDERGLFTELFKTNERGQFSVNIIKPGITKGNHWHNTKNEKFIVVSGKGVIKFRKIGCNKIIEYYVDDKNIKIIDIPVGYTHNITNLGNTNMVVIMWANEIYNAEKSDTYFLKVNN